MNSLLLNGQLSSSSYCHQKNYLNVFDLKKYSASEKALLKLIPVVKTSNKAL